MGEIAKSTKRVNTLLIQTQPILLNVQGLGFFKGYSKS